MQAAISEIDLDSRSVTLTGSVCDDLDGYVIADEPDQERELAYDSVVLALGAEPITDLVQGAKVHLQQHRNDHDPDQHADGHVDFENFHGAKAARQARKPLAQSGTHHNAESDPERQVTLEKADDG